MSWLDMNVCFTLRVHYLDKDKARDLKCYWSPDDKKWKKLFNKRFYSSVDNHEFLSIVKRFKQTCCDNDLIIEDDEGLEDLQDWCDEDRAITEKCLAKPVERHVPIAKSPIDAYRGTGIKCLIVDDEETRISAFPMCSKCNTPNYEMKGHMCLSCYNDWDKGNFKKADKCLIVDDE